MVCEAKGLLTAQLVKPRGGHKESSRCLSMFWLPLGNMFGASEAESDTEGHRTHTQQRQHPAYVRRPDGSHSTLTKCRVLTEILLEFYRVSKSIF